MRALRIKEVASSFAGTLHGELLGSDCEFASVSSDSRSIVPGDLFVALAGENHDGHDYLRPAADAGAVAAIVSRSGDYPIPCIKVSDTTAALGQLAALNRRYFTGTLLGITGSSGKTTVKNMLSRILSRQGLTHATAGNFNNEIGVPQTLLGLSAGHQYAVIEMGASAGGDIEYLSALAEPTIAVLLNAQPAHLQGFGSLAGVAAAKGEIFSSLPADGVGVLNADSEFTSLWRELLGRRTYISFGCSAAADIRAENIENLGAAGCRFDLCSEWGVARLKLPLPGRHNVLNALAACAASLAAKLSVAEVIDGLEHVHPAPGRLSVSQGANGAMIIDDSYNANPGSVRAAIDTLVATPGHRVLMLGVMGELGADSPQLHREIAAYARARGVDELWLIGEAAMAADGFGCGARLYSDIDSLPELHARFSRGDVVLVKGSRMAGMEAVVARLKAGAEAN